MSCNVRPLLSALELKYQLPCPDNLWNLPTAVSWSLLLQAQTLSFNMNEEDDTDGNPDPRPAHGDLYEFLLQLIRRDTGVRQPLGLLWYSPFASLMLIMQMQMMIRDMTLASVFFFSNKNLETKRHNLYVYIRAYFCPCVLSPFLDAKSNVVAAARSSRRRTDPRFFKRFRA